ncbi:hypothetical protein K8354_04505 [Polaribacter litorisediminis]|uniref:DUF6090 family protein n=1 Tax=Polaribacter litorisediminis TaxID=1908341 RepID=UPI001CBF4FCB|nr:DUF6090 family protein [Polaribacter litorisediminis]UAM99092.1 hypothetical protein K8354_04505 [Polaribacter litorisediminis]
MEKNLPTGQAGKTGKPAFAAGKYFKYAIGEIILVMIGILLALQVSNWNQDRKDRISERKLLDNIHRDFVHNKVFFDSLKVIHYRGLNDLDKLVDLFSLNNDSLKQEAYKKYNLQIKNMTYDPYSSSIESVVNSNALQLIQDENLQKYLVSWKDVFLDYKEDENKYNDYLNDFLWPYYRDVFDYTLKDTAMNQAARNSIKFQNMIITRRINIRGIIYSIENESIENHINEIIRLTQPTN